MEARQWTTGRQSAKLTQVQAAAALGVTQPYLSQLEAGSRTAAAALAQKAAALYRLPPTALPLPALDEVKPVEPDDLQRDLATLGYPRFAHVPKGHQRNPAEVLLAAVMQDDLDARLVEALPWVVSTYVDVNWPWLRDAVKLKNRQNRMGYLVHLAMELVKASGEESKTQVLSHWQEELEQARLAREDTLCNSTLPLAARRWLKERRPPAAAHWNLLTGLTVEQLQYAAN